MREGILSSALCHSTVDDSFAAGIGRRLDGWANRDLNSEQEKDELVEYLKSL
jgi:hypothetical protein